MHTTNEIIDAVQGAVRPARFLLDGAPVTVNAMVSGKIQASASMENPLSISVIESLKKDGASIQKKPSKGVACAVVNWTDMERVILSGRVTMP